MISVPLRISSLSRSCVWVLLGFLLVSTTVSAEVVTLTDQTFEHQTQASTGMTTGSWLVLFTVPDCNSCETLKPVLEDLGKQEDLAERGIVLATVDCSKDKETCLRFSTNKLPVLLYLHKKEMYHYHREKDDEFGTTARDLRSFVLAPTVGSEAEPIPDPPSALDAFLQPILLIYENNPLAGYAIFGMLAMMGITTLVLLTALVRGPKGKAEPKGKTKSKSSESKKNK